MNYFRRATAILVCFLISPLAGMAQPQGGAQRAGQINAIIPSATRNAQPTKVQDEIDWNDVLKTAHSGRVRAGLTDGSILSVGSDSELRVIQHDATSQQTSLELTYGKVRNQVTTITKAGGKYELKTPNAVIGVIGTDFITIVTKNKTKVICIKGRVTVTPIAKAAAITLTDGQMVEITNAVPSGGYQASSTSAADSQAGLLATDVPDNGTLPPPGKGYPHPWRTIIIGGAVVTGISVGLGVGLGHSKSSSQCPPSSSSCG